MTNGRRFRSVWTLLAAAGLALAATACGTDNQVTTEAKAEFILPAEMTNQVIDFGTIAMNSEATLVVGVKNVGNASLTLEQPEFTAPFSHDIKPAGITLAPGASETFKVSFKPTEADVYDLAVTIKTTGGNFKGTLKGTSVAPNFNCAPTALAFGKVVYGTAKTLTVTCTNTTPVDTYMRVAPISGDDRQFFTHPFTANDGRVLVPAGTPKDIPVTFHPTSLDEKFALLELYFDDGSELMKITLTATVIPQAFEAAPALVDFGYVAPGTCNTVPTFVELRNMGADPLLVNDAQFDVASDPGVFSFTAEDGSALAFPLTIPPAESDDVPGLVKVVVKFCPDAAALGTRNAWLVFKSSDGQNKEDTVNLTGFAGGPVISCSPDLIDFGLVAKGIPLTRTFTCSNVGTAAPGRTDDKLVVTSVVSENAAEYKFDPEVVLNDGGYGVTEGFQVSLKYDPQDDGVDDAKIVIHSNSTVGNAPATGGYQPSDYVITLTGHGRDLPPCEWDVRPPTLQFGVVDAGNDRTLEFGIHNNRTDSECFVQNLHIAEEGSSNYSLVGGDVAFAELAPGGDLRYQVKFAPPVRQTDPYVGWVEFTITNKDRPLGRVDLIGASQEPCAMLAPDILDFGVVKPNCSTRDREMSIINTCAQPLVIDHIVMGDSVDDEFILKSAPPNGHNVPSGLEALFTMAYRPVNEGPDVGSVEIWVQGMSVPYVAQLLGEGRQDATQTDKFSQNERPKVDLLWVIDNSGSMSEEQGNIAANMRPFLSFAQAQQIEYHIAVTTTGIQTSGGCPGGADGGEAGRFFPVDNSRPRIITPETPNLEQVWQQNVAVGTCHGTELPFEAAYLALSPPLVDNPDDPRTSMPNDGNAGFLRKEAHLSIIAMTDEQDQSPQTVNFYYNFFQSLKGFRNTHLFNFHAITGDEFTGCSSPQGNAEMGDRLIAMVRKTDGGQFQSICASNWAESLQRMSVAAFGFKTCFFLGNQPEDTNNNGVIRDDPDGEVTVKLNGRVVPSIGPAQNNYWQYSKDQNAICFFPYAVPEPGTQIEIKYRVACLQ